MNTRRTHHVTTTDGVEIGGSIRGQGPPVVLLQGVMGDGHLDWQALRPYLADRFTCYLPSWRGRGLSGDHLDLSYVPLVDDAVAYVDSIGQPTGLVGWSGGAGLERLAASSIATAVWDRLCGSIPMITVMITPWSETVDTTADSPDADRSPARLSRATPSHSTGPTTHRYEPDPAGSTGRSRVSRPGAAGR